MGHPVFACDVEGRRRGRRCRRSCSLFSDREASPPSEKSSYFLIASTLSIARSQFALRLGLSLPWQTHIGRQSEWRKKCVSLSSVPRQMREVAVMQQTARPICYISFCHPPPPPPSSSPSIPSRHGATTCVRARVRTKNQQTRRALFSSSLSSFSSPI